MFKRPLVLAAAAFYASAMLGLVGGIGVMASSRPMQPQGSGYGAGFALIMMLNK